MLFMDFLFEWFLLNEFMDKLLFWECSGCIFGFILFFFLLIVVSKLVGELFWWSKLLFSEWLWKREIFIGLLLWSLVVFWVMFCIWDNEFFMFFFVIVEFCRVFSFVLFVWIVKYCFVLFIVLECRVIFFGFDCWVYFEGVDFMMGIKFLLKNIGWLFLLLLVLFFNGFEMWGKDFLLNLVKDCKIEFGVEW